ILQRPGVEPGAGRGLGGDRRQALGIVASGDAPHGTNGRQVAIGEEVAADGRQPGTKRREGRGPRAGPEDQEVHGPPRRTPGPMRRQASAEEKSPRRGPENGRNRAAGRPGRFTRHSTTTSIFEAVRTFFPSSSETSPV